jgi:hypothetical protein
MFGQEVTNKEAIKDRAIYECKLCDEWKYQKEMALVDLCEDCRKVK